MLRFMQLSKAHIEMLAYLSAGFAEVSLASIVLPYVLDEFQPLWALFGVVLLIGFSLVAVLSFHHSKL